MNTFYGSYASHENFLVTDSTELAELTNLSITKNR